MTPLRIKRQVRQYHAFFYLNLDLFALAHGNLYEHTWIDLAKKKTLYRFNSSPLLPGSLTFMIARHRACLFLIKLLWKFEKSQRGRSCSEAFFRRSKILNCSVYSALWLGGLRCLSIQETNQWATGCSLSLHDGPWQKKTKKNFCAP